MSPPTGGRYIVFGSLITIMMVTIFKVKLALKHGLNFFENLPVKNFIFKLKLFIDHLNVS